MEPKNPKAHTEPPQAIPAPLVAKVSPDGGRKSKRAKSNPGAKYGKVGNRVFESMPQCAGAMAHYGVTLERLKLAKQLGSKAIKHAGRWHEAIILAELKRKSKAWPVIEPPKTKGETLDEASARRMTAIADKVEFKNKIELGEYISRKEVEFELARAVNAAKAQIMSIPDRHAQEFSLLTDINTIREKLSADCHAALENLTSGKWADFACPHCGKEIKL